MKLYPLITLLFVLHLLSVKPVYAQHFTETNYGINGGIIIALGNKVDRIGIHINAYYLKNNIQLNPGFRVYYNFKNLGPNKKYIEAHASLGLVYGYGKKNDSDTNLFYSSISNQTQHKNSIGYSFNYYLNPIGTTQQTGIISFQFNQFNFVAENDIFARPKLDRYRTGAFLIQYQKNKTQLGINSTLFTGQMGAKVPDEKYPHSRLYKTSTKGKYTQYSHGLLSAQIKYADKYYQNYQANIGIDSERVRHAIQNRLIHDQIFLPRKWRSKSGAHIPMIDSNGNPYLFKENQKVKPLQLYINGFVNPLLFY